MENKQQKVFKEEQKFDQKWIWVLLIVTAVVILSVQITVFFSSSTEKSGFSFYFSIFNVLLVIGLIWLFAKMKLITKIDEETISMQFFPFVNKQMKWSEVEEAEVLDYGFVGGWGIRLWTKYGTVYNIKGSQGLFIRLKNNKKFLIGTQRPDELSGFMESEKNLSSK